MEIVPRGVLEGDLEFGRWLFEMRRRRRLCGATDGLGLFEDPDEAYGRCNLPAGHEGGWHQEWHGDRLWAEWRGPHPGERCTLCGKDGAEH